MVTRAIRPLWMIALFLFYGSIAQLVEQRTENPCVVGSIPTGATIYYLKSYERKWLIWKVILVVILIVIFLD